MLIKDLKKKYIEFFKGKAHKEIPNASLIPSNDPTVLFTTAGMHPLVPYLLGQEHPLGKRLVNIQKCLRTDDIEEVGDDFHLTFFEMLGNWSLGDYFKKESIEWSFEFLTDNECLGLDPDRIYVTVFAGDKDAPRDNESAKIWKDLGIPESQIIYLPKKDNWWGPAGKTGPCGPDTEVFYDTGKDKCSSGCKPGCDCGKYEEIWNNVFMEYEKTENGIIPLVQKNVDTGVGVERLIVPVQNKSNIYETEMFVPIIKRIKDFSKTSDIKSERIIADHMRSVVFILNEGIPPSNVEHGYVLRKLIRRCVRCSRNLGIREKILQEIAAIIIDQYKSEYPELVTKKDFIFEEIEKEENKFIKTLEDGIRHFRKIKPTSGKIDGKDAFILFSSYGFPIEMTVELAKEKGWSVDKKDFEKEFQKHQKLSRTTSSGTFRSGLSDASKETTKLHTATHLLNEALRHVIDKNIRQRGSNITPERLRFDFNFSRKLTKEELKKLEEFINKKIQENLPVKKEEMPFKQALESGAQAEFGARYPDIVFVYNIGKFSKEICTGPHVENTKQIGKIKIVKEQAVGAGIRRIKAIIEKPN